jgi:hypothetical protein
MGLLGISDLLAHLPAILIALGAPPWLAAP